MLMPSVTEVLQPWADFSRIPPAVLEAAAVRGTAVHDVCANIARGLMVINQQPETIGYVNSFRRWFDFMVSEVLLAEERLIDIELGFHGEPDLIIKSKSEGIILVDNKTPVTLQKTWKLQLSAYRHLADKNIVTPDRVGSLRLHPEGKVARMDYYDNSARDFNLFLQSLNLHNYFKS